ncbi:MAG: GntR family transcriptional regulator [Pseudomonadota bacterium]
MIAKSPVSSEKLTAEPLYRRVRTRLVERLIQGDWKPGAMLPSEFAIADQLGVSQGTVRKALDEMTVEGILERRQGKGTFVAQAEDTAILFRFYRLTRDNGDGTAERTFPRSHYLSHIKTTASQEERDVFQIPSGRHFDVWRFERVRYEADEPILWERLVLPSQRFPKLDTVLPLPNNVYRFYADTFGLMVKNVHEKLRAVAASAIVSDHLNLPPNSPVLEIDRRAIALDDDTIEWRVSHCRSDTMHYRNEL